MFRKGDERRQRTLTIGKDDNWSSHSLFLLVLADRRNKMIALHYSIQQMPPNNEVSCLLCGPFIEICAKRRPTVHTRTWWQRQSSVGTVLAYVTLPPPALGFCPVWGFSFKQNQSVGEHVTSNETGHSPVFTTGTSKIFCTSSAL